MFKSVFLSLLLFCASAFALEAPFGIPTTKLETTHLDRKGYSVEYYSACKTPLVVVEHLVPKNIGCPEERRTFKADPDLPDEVKAKLTDYAGRQKLNIDIGHLAPAADFQSDGEEMEQSFYLSNTVPQAAKHNRGIWRMLEMRVRALAVKQGDIYVFTGGIYDSSVKIGSGVCKPSKMFKVVIDVNRNQSIGYLIPNTDTVARDKIDKYAMTMMEIEAYTGINFTPELDQRRSLALKNRIGADFNQK